MTEPCEHFNLTMTEYEKVNDRPTKFVVHAQCADCDAPVDILSAGPEEDLAAALAATQETP